MLKTTKLKAKGWVQLPDTFTAFTNAKKGDEVDMYFGANFDIVIITQKNANINRDNKERIRILTEVK